MKTATGVLKTIGQRKKVTVDKLSLDNKGSLHRIDKKQVSMQKGSDEGGGTVLGATMVPTDKQLEKINAFTRVDATADNVVAFRTLACNDLFDRDDERFTTETVKEFSSLPQPFSPVGKSYMVDHDYEVANIQGRIFDVTHKSIDGVRHLIPDVYIPKTEQHKDFIENIDFGLNNFVSVGVVIDKSSCTICKSPVYTSRFSGWSWCEEGHEKGYYYVPGQEEEDGWGWYLPVDPATKGAVKAQVDMSDPIDFYELSQVFLGAQFYAELAKKPGFKGVIKAASAAKVPMLGLAFKDGDEIKMPHEPEEVSKARQQKFVIETDKDGTRRWTDDKGLVYLYDLEDNEVRCLGKAAVDKNETRIKTKLDELREKRESTKQMIEDYESDTDEDDDPAELAEAVDAVLDELEDALDNGDYATADDLLTAAEGSIDDLVELLGGVDNDDQDDGGNKSGKKKAAKDSDDDDDDEEEEEEDDDDSTKSAVLKSATKAKLPTDIIEGVADGDIDDLLAACAKEIRSARKTIAEMEPKAAIADEAVKEAEANVLHWYTVAHRDPKNPERGVNIDTAKKLVERCGGDITLLKELADDYRKDAVKLFPVGVRRSSVHDDPNKREPAGSLPNELTEHGEDPRVAKLHT